MTSIRPKEQGLDAGGTSGIGVNAINDTGQEEEEDVQPEVADIPQPYEEVAEEESVKIPKLKKPHEPSQEEIDEHDLSHIPFRSWCPSCVRGRALNDSHQHLCAEDEHRLPTLCCDYSFLVKDESKAMPILAQRDTKSLTAGLNVVTKEGPDCEYAVRTVVTFIQKCGYRRFIQKSDQEPSILALRDKANAKLGPGFEIVPEKSPVGEHQSNGAVEGMIGHLTGLVRTHRDAVEQKFGIVLDTSTQVLAWLVMWVAFCYNTYHRGKDGRTARERLKGKAYKKKLCPWGEKVHWLPLVKRQKALEDEDGGKTVGKVTVKLYKLANKWRSDGHFSGVVDESDEIYIGIPGEGVVKARAMDDNGREERRPEPT